MGLNTTGSLPNSQSAKMPEYSVCNLLKLIKRFGNRLVTFTSRNEWYSLPEKLTVDHDGKYYGQKISQSSFYTDERASLGFVFNRIFLSLDAGAAGYFRKLDTDLWGVGDISITDEERLTTDYLRIFAQPRLEWRFKSMELTLNCPVNLYSYFFSGGLTNKTEFFISPSLSARFRITPRMSLTLRGSANRSPANLHNIHDSSILTDYRSFSSGVNDYYTTSGHSVSASYSFRNPQQGIFVIATGSFGWNKSKYGMMQNIVGDYIFHSYRSNPSDSKNIFAMLNISKTLDFMRGSVGLRGNFRRMDNNLISQDVPTYFQSDALTLSPFVMGNISSVLNWNLHFTWNRSTLKIMNMSGRYSDSFIYSGNITLTPCDLITWSAGGEFYHNEIEPKRYKEMLMLDTKLSFNVSKRLEISASVTNLLNRKEYSYTSYGTVSQYESSSLLRGREFLISIYLKK